MNIIWPTYSAISIPFYQCYKSIFKLNDTFWVVWSSLIMNIVWPTCSAVSIPFYQCYKSIFKLNDSFEWYGQVELWIFHVKIEPITPVKTHQPKIQPIIAKSNQLINLIKKNQLKRNPKSNTTMKTQCHH